VTIASMTGFARARGAHGEAAWTWELKSVNGRGLDLRFRAPPGFEQLEPALREALAAALARGNVQAALSVDRPPRPAEVRINQTVLEAVAAAAEAIRARTGAPPATVDGILSIRGVVDVTEARESEEEHAALIAALAEGFRRAAAELVAARRAEGAALAGLLRGQLDAIERLVAEAEAHPGRRPEAIRGRLAESVRALIVESDRFDPDRLHQEAVLLAARADIREELDRLAAHVAHARRLLADGGPVGRKLDFLAQEFNREANTLCSKSSDRELTAIGLSLKTVVDQMREQIQNVE
jgi:uncharacterized protein (TIGR00255 family)